MLMVGNVQTLWINLPGRFINNVCTLLNKQLRIMKRIISECMGRVIESRNNKAHFFVSK